MGTCAIASRGALGTWRGWVPEHPLKQFRSLPASSSCPLPTVSGSLPPGRSSRWATCRSHTSQHVQWGHEDWLEGPWSHAVDMGIAGSWSAACAGLGGRCNRRRRPVRALRECAGSGLGPVQVGGLHLALDKHPLRYTAASSRLCPSRGTGQGKDSTGSRQHISTASGPASRLLKK